MFSLKPIFLFAAKIFLFYLLFVGLFSWMGASYTKTFNKINTVVFGDFGSNGLVKFKVEKPKESPFLVKMEMYSKKMIREVQKKAAQGQTSASVNMIFYNFDIWLYAILPMIVVMSFVLSSPVPPLQMLKALLLGILITQLLTLLKIGITITNETYLNPWLQITDSWWQTFFANPSATKSMTNIFRMVGFSLVISIFVWVGVTFRKRDWRKFSRLLDKLNV